jgi:hypothetical protein
MNTNIPKVRQIMQWAQGAGRNTSYGQAIYYPYGGDMARTFVDLIQMYRAKQGLQPALFQIASVTRLAAPSGWRRVHITGQMDAGEGLGMEEINDVFCCSPPGPAGGFMTYTDASAVPLQFADQERDTMVAILSSFRVDQQTVAAQSAAVAAPEIARIHEIGRRAAQQAADAHAAEDAQAAAYEKTSRAKPSAIICSTNPSCATTKPTPAAPSGTRPPTPSYVPIRSGTNTSTRRAS